MKKKLIATLSLLGVMCFASGAIAGPAFKEEFVKIQKLDDWILRVTKGGTTTQVVEKDPTVDEMIMYKDRIYVRVAYERDYFGKDLNVDFTNKIVHISDKAPVVSSPSSNTPVIPSQQPSQSVQHPSMPQDPNEKENVLAPTDKEIREHVGSIDRAIYSNGELLNRYHDGEITYKMMDEKAQKNYERVIPYLSRISNSPKSSLAYKYYELAKRTFAQQMAAGETLNEADYNKALDMSLELDKLYLEIMPK